MNHIQHLLEAWYPRKDEQYWVLAVLSDVEGASYRKPGAMMLFNDIGQYFGLLSGGCLEKELQIKAKQVFQTQQDTCVTFNLQAEEDGWQSVLGCGGKLTICLLLVDEKRDYLHLDVLYHMLSERKSCRYSLCFSRVESSEKTLPLTCVQSAVEGNFSKTTPSHHVVAEIQQTASTSHLAIVVSPLCHLLIVGGGPDVQPVVRLAADVLGWQVTIIDPRSGYAKKQDFTSVKHIERKTLDTLIDDPIWQGIDAALVMSHNIHIDAQAIMLLQNHAVSYIGVMGSQQRIKRLLTMSGLDSQQQLDAIIAKQSTIFAPAGLDIAADLPESIALSMLSECHAVLFGQGAGVAAKQWTI